VRKAALLVALGLALLPARHAFADRILYKEQYYKLYHEQLYHYPDDTMESIYYLEQALKSDFANPLYALAKIDNKTDWQRYRDLFYLHVDLKLVYLYLTLGSKWDKQVAYFYNAPWKRQNLESLETAEEIYRQAFYYWDEAKRYSASAWTLRTVHLPDIQEWEDENFRIETGALDYQEIIDAQLAHVAKVRAEFEAMGPGTY
jgi:hypothetical protein